MFPSPSQPSHTCTRRDALRTVAFALGATVLPGGFGFIGSAAAASPTPAATPPPMKVTPLADQLRWISGLGGNIVVLGGEDGALVVDSGLPDAAAKTLAELRKSQPLSMVVNTHWHYDHVGANQQLAEAGARIFASENCRNRMATEQNLEALGLKVPASNPRALPHVTSATETTLHINGEIVRLIPATPAHTDGDLIIRFENADLIHCGDLFFNGSYPFIDWSSGGWIGGVVAAGKEIIAMSGAKTRLIPGHGPLATLDEFKSYVAFLEDMQSRFEKFKAEGKTVDEVVAAGPAKEFDEKLGKLFLKTDQFVRITYTGLLKHQ
jgi:glyoxylase-like metal-dependent hydrolase (beta-lactamase superfamily II)